jgi:Peptidase family S58
MEHLVRRAVIDRPYRSPLLLRGLRDLIVGISKTVRHILGLCKDDNPVVAARVPNAFGKLAGSTQVNELGEIETPILLTSTLADVGGISDACRMLHNELRILEQGLCYLSATESAAA